MTTSACFVLDILRKVSLACPGAAGHPADPLSFPFFTIQSFLVTGAEEQAVIEAEVVSGHIPSVSSVHAVLSGLHCSRESFSELSLCGLRDSRAPAALSLAPARQPACPCRGRPAFFAFSISCFSSACKTSVGN